MMRALIVGAGAVGQVFAHHLAQGGADVTFLVKFAHVEAALRGFTLYHLSHSKARSTAPIALHAPVVTAPAGGFDQVYLAVTSPALLGAWLPELARTTGDATIVLLTAGPDDVARVLVHVDRARFAHAGVHFLAYAAPLPGETRFSEPGIAYWLFPGKAPVSGERAADVVRAMTAGGLPAHRVPDTDAATAFPSAVLRAVVGALEAGDWSFAALRGEPGELGARAAREALAIVGRERGVRAPFALRAFGSPRVFRTALAIARRVVPVDLEAYMQAHFTKVGAQMHEGLRTYVERGRAAALDVSALAQLVHAADR